MAKFQKNDIIRLKDTNTVMKVIGIVHNDYVIAYYPISATDGFFVNPISGIDEDCNLMFYPSDQIWNKLNV